MTEATKEFHLHLELCSPCRRQLNLCVQGKALLEAAAEAEKHPADPLHFDDAIKIAKGCFDYGGGYKEAGDREKFHHGIGTVLNSLKGARDKGLADPQIKILHQIGSRSDA